MKIAEHKRRGPLTAKRQHKYSIETCGQNTFGLSSSARTARQHLDVVLVEQYATKCTDKPRGRRGTCVLRTSSYLRLLAVHDCTYLAFDRAISLLATWTQYRSILCIPVVGSPAQYLSYFPHGRKCGCRKNMALHAPLYYC